MNRGTEELREGYIEVASAPDITRRLSRPISSVAEVERRVCEANLTTPDEFGTYGSCVKVKSESANSSVDREELTIA